MAICSMSQDTVVSLVLICENLPKVISSTLCF